MVNYCCVAHCKSSALETGISFRGFPKDEKMSKAWKVKIRRSASTPLKDDFSVTKYTKVCSKHFNENDFLYFDTKRRTLKSDAVPTIFPWKETKRRRSPRKRHDSSGTDSASEDDFPLQDSAADASIQVDIPVTCHHQFSVSVLRSAPVKQRLFPFYTGFANEDIFKAVLKLVVPDENRTNITYWDNRASKTYINGSSLFDSDEEVDVLDNDDSDDEDTPSNSGRQHALAVEDEFLMTLMKLKLGLFNKDLAVRFCVSVSTVSRIIKTWINLIYIRLGSLKIFPHRDVILANMTKDYKKKSPTSMIIIDCTELKIESPSSLILKSQTYSNYKSTNTFKCLIGVDSRGSIMYVSHLYTGSISDKEICVRSGFMDLLKHKLSIGELAAGDAVMADKGFDMSKELDEINMKLNIPSFLGKRKQLSSDEVANTQLIAHHRIHIERAIGKVRNFHIFDRQYRLKSAGIVNQIWTDCCLLSNFQDPIILKASTVQTTPEASTSTETEAMSNVA